MSWPWAAAKHPPTSHSSPTWNGKKIEGRWKDLDRWEGWREKEMLCKLCSARAERLVRYQRCFSNKCKAQHEVNSSPGRPSRDVKILCSYQTIWKVRWPAFIFFLLNWNTWKWSFRYLVFGWLTGNLLSMDITFWKLEFVKHSKHNGPTTHQPSMKKSRIYRIYKIT